MSDVLVHDERAVRLTKSGRPDRRGAPGVQKGPRIRRSDKVNALPTRRVALKLYPTPTELQAIEAQSDAHRLIWNWSHTRISAYHEQTKKLISLVELLRDLTDFRHHEGLATCAYSAAAQAQAGRCHTAWHRYLTRDATGKKFGKPRLKSAKRKVGWEYQSYKSGFWYQTANEHQAALRAEVLKQTGEVLSDPFAPVEGEDAKAAAKREKASRSHGRLYLSRIGTVKVRGVPRNITLGIRNVSVMYRDGNWYASLVTECVSEREIDPSLGPVGFDTGTETLVTLAYKPGEYVAIKNDRLLKQISGEIATIQQKINDLLNGKTIDKLSSRKRKAVNQLYYHLARAMALLERKRTDRAHKLSCDIARHPMVVTEMQDIVEMTASNKEKAKEKRAAKGAVRTPRPGSPGTWGAKRKAKLNAQVLDTTPGLLLKLVSIKAEEAGYSLICLDPKIYKPSQNCPYCKTVQYKPLDQRQHRCPCGFAASRDQAAALYMLRVGLEKNGMGTVPDAWNWPHLAASLDHKSGNHVLETATKAAAAAWSG